MKWENSTLCKNLLRRNKAKAVSKWNECEHLMPVSRGKYHWNPPGLRNKNPLVESILLREEYHSIL